MRAQHFLYSHKMSLRNEPRSSVPFSDLTHVCVFISLSLSLSLAHSLPTHVAVPRDPSVQNHYLCPHSAVAWPLACSSALLLVC